MKYLPAILTVVLLGCGHRTEQFVLPDQITDFATLYNANCAGCHGMDGRSGAARSLNDPLYLALIGKEKLGDVIAKGVPGTAMPPFAEGAGGSLTEQQVNILAGQIEARWSRPKDFTQATLPPYSAEPGDAARGQAVFNSDCAKCHGEGAKGGSILDPSFLALVSDQSLRTSVIAGTPDCRSGRPLTPQEVSDLVAWLSAHRNPLKGGKGLL
jgi:mono/diheme cytochrome c family protein